MKKRVLLLYCNYYHNRPIGIDLDNPKECIRLVADDGDAGEVQVSDIDFARSLDVITFDGHPVPQGKEQENWTIDNHSCRCLGKWELNGNSDAPTLLDWVYKNYGYHGFWNNTKPYLDKAEFEAMEGPSVSILKVSEVRIYNNDFNKSKIDFKWSGHKICGISLSSLDYYEKLDNGHTITFDNAYIVISIPKEADFVSMNGERRAYKFVRKVYEIPSL